MSGGARVGIGLLCRRAVDAASSSARIVRDGVLAFGAGEQAVVADAVEAVGQDVDQEAPDELVGVSRMTFCDRRS